MTDRSPCLSCDALHEDKLFSQRCQDCSHRDRYVHSLAGAGFSLPIKSPGADPMPRSREWTEKDIQFVKNNVDTMNDAHLGAVLGRSGHAVCQIRSRLNITRAADFKRGILAKPANNEPCKKQEPPEALAELADTSKTPGKPADFGTRPDFFILDFSQRPELFAALKRLAGQHFRQPADEVFFLIHQATDQVIEQ